MISASTARTSGSLRVRLPQAAHEVDVYAEYYGEVNKKLQVVVTPAISDDPALHIRFNDDGSINSIVVDAQYMHCVRRNNGTTDAWMKARDLPPT